jgi:hypothetical protein
MVLPRLQLFEFNDHPRAPAVLKECIIETLSRTLAWGHILKGLVGPLEQFLDAVSANGAARCEVLDLGAGAGGPASILVEEIRAGQRTPPRFLLTDLQPRVESWRRLRAAEPDAIDFIAEPVDATAIPWALAAGRPRTIINVFHHFPPPLARAILADAVKSSPGVFIAEGFERDPRQFLNFGPAGLPALLANPILSPRDRLAKALLTWATPIALLCGTFDGLVSTLRVYTEAELRAMVAPLDPTWRWTYGTYTYPPRGRGYYFWGVPGGASKPGAHSR